MVNNSRVITRADQVKHVTITHIKELFMTSNLRAIKEIASTYLGASEQVTIKAQKIKLLLLDVDGVLSDGRISFDNHGLETKSFNTKDGQGLKVLRASGVEVGIITGRRSAIVEKRAKELGIHILAQGREDKFTAMSELLEIHKYDLDQIAFMGDDYPDLTVMTKIGLAMSVQDAHFAVKHFAHWISPRKGGQGAVRDACDLIMLAQNTFDHALEKNL